MGDEAEDRINYLISVPTQRQVVAHTGARLIARCKTTELLVRDCGCRLHRGKPSPPAPADPFESAQDTGAHVTAQFYSDCSYAGDPIEPGDTIVSDGADGWSHVDCDGMDL
jgi:hypothetical protein